LHKRRSGPDPPFRGVVYQASAHLSQLASQFGLPDRFQVKFVYSSPPSPELYAIGQSAAAALIHQPSAASSTRRRKSPPPGFPHFSNYCGVAEELARARPPDAMNEGTVAPKGAALSAAHMPVNAANSLAHPLFDGLHRHWHARLERAAGD
jgi:hypothetical protein